MQALANHETLSYSERLKASAQRIEENGVKNVLIKKQLEYLKTAIDHIHQNKVIDLFIYVGLIKSILQKSYLDKKSSISRAFF